MKSNFLGRIALYLAFGISALLAPIYTEAGVETLKYLQNHHHYHVGYSKDKRIVLLRVLDSRSGLPVFTAYPHGSDDALKKVHRHVKMSRKRFKRAVSNFYRLSNRNVSIKAVAENPSFHTGLGLGYSNALGYIGGQSVCYHFTTELTGEQDRFTFSSKQTGSTLASQTNLNASVDLALGFFKANNDFSYSNNYQNSANSGRITYSAGSVYTTSNTLVEPSSFGMQAFDGGSFESQCGTDFVTSMQVGMLVMGELGWSSTSSEATQKIEDTLKVDFGIGNLKAAVASANSVINTQSEFQFNLTIYGGGNDAAFIIEDAYTNNLSLRNDCLKGLNVDACSQFTAKLEEATASGIKAFKAKMTPEALPQDLGFLEPFPYGIMGITQTSTFLHIPVSKLQKAGNINPPPYLLPYANAIKNWMNIMGDVSALRNRAEFLSGRLYDQTTKTNIFNPFPMRDIANDDIAPLSTTYLRIRADMITTLQDCLAADKDTVADKCKLIQDNASTTTFIYLAQRQNSSGGRNAFANYIGLQYVGLYSDFHGNSYPIDFVYTDSLGTVWPKQSPTMPPAGPALLGFVDSKYLIDNQSTTDPWSSIISLNTIFTATPVVSPYLYAFGKRDWAWQNGLPLNYQVASGCDSQIYNPCTFTASAVAGGSGIATISLFPIRNIFAK